MDQLPKEYSSFPALDAEKTLMQREGFAKKAQTGSLIFGLLGIILALFVAIVVVGAGIYTHASPHFYIEGLKAGWIVGGGIALVSFTTSGAIYICRKKKEAQ